MNDVCSNPEAWVRANGDALKNLAQGNGIKSVSADAPAGTQCGVILVDSTAGNTTVTLPAVADVPAGKLITVKKLVAANDVVVDGAGAETIDGAATKTLSAQYATLKVISDGTEWHVL